MAEATSRDELAHLFTGLGVRSGGVLMVHASLRGTMTEPETVRDALRDALGPDGTLIVPAFTPENSLTSRAHLNRIAGLDPVELREVLAAALPFDRDATACPTMGALAECVRATPGSVRSAHPQTSLAGLGPRAGELLAGHALDCHLGERSPLAKLYGAGAQILLLRVGFEVCTAFHLAEYRTPRLPATRTYWCVTEDKGKWTRFTDLHLDDSDFAEIGAALAPEHVSRSVWASKEVSLCAMPVAVDHAREQMARYRPGLT